MLVVRSRIRALLFISAAALILGAGGTQSYGQGAATEQPAQTPVGRTLGTIQSISGNNIVLATQNGATVAVAVQDGARILHVEPGEKDLKNASAITLQDLQVGDRVLVFGKASDDTKSFAANRVVAMKKMDIEARQQKDRDDWQKRGAGGLVTAVDPSAGRITISVTSVGGTKPLTVQTSKDTAIRRYAPDSVKFDDAKVATLDQIEPGDQLRARGARSADGSSFAAEEIVAGSFRNIAGTISSIDTAAGTMTVMDLATKKALTVKVTSDSEVRKLPLMMAQGIAARFRGGATPSVGASGQTPANAAGSSQSQTPAASGGGGQPGQGGAAGGARRAGGGGGGAGFQQIVDRMPPSTLTDFQKGDAVMIVSTEGTDSGAVTAITLLGGVEPILAATPKGGQPMTLSPWSLGGGGGEAGGGDTGGGR